MEVSTLARETMLPRLSLYPLDYRAALALLGRGQDRSISAH